MAIRKTNRGFGNGILLGIKEITKFNRVINGDIREEFWSFNLNDRLKLISVDTKNI